MLIVLVICGPNFISWIIGRIILKNINNNVHYTKIIL